MDIDTLRRDAEAPMIAGADNLAGVATDLADAFTNDIMLNWFLPHRRAPRPEAHQRFFPHDRRPRLAPGAAAWSARPAAGAAAVWMPFEAVGPMSLSDELRRPADHAPRHRAWRVFIRLFSLRGDMDKHHPMDRRHAYLWFLGVSREAQGHGVGLAPAEGGHRPPRRRGAARLPGDPDRAQYRPLSPPRFYRDLRAQARAPTRPTPVEHVARSCYGTN